MISVRREVPAIAHMQSGRRGAIESERKGQEGERRAHRRQFDSPIVEDDAGEPADQVRGAHQERGIIERRNALRGQAFIVGRFGAAQVEQQGFGNRRFDRQFTA